MFSFDDVINAVMNKSQYTLENRLPLYVKLGLMNGASSQEAVSTDEDSSSLLFDNEDFDSGEWGTNDANEGTGAADDTELDEGTGADRESAAEDSEYQPQPIEDVAQRFNNTGWTNEERMNAADMLLKWYLQGRRSANPELFERLNIPQIKSSLIQLIVSWLAGLGY